MCPKGYVVLFMSIRPDDYNGLFWLHNIQINPTT